MRGQCNQPVAIQWMWIHRMCFWGGWNKAECFPNHWHSLKVEAQVEEMLEDSTELTGTGLQHARADTVQSSSFPLLEYLQLSPHLASILYYTVLYYIVLDCTIRLDEVLYLWKQCWWGDENYKTEKMNSVQYHQHWSENNEVDLQWTCLSLWNMYYCEHSPLRCYCYYIVSDWRDCEWTVIMWGFTSELRLQICEAGEKSSLCFRDVSSCTLKILKPKINQQQHWDTQPTETSGFLPHSSINLCCNINFIKNKFLLKFEEKWFENVLLKPKLRTYMQIKSNFGPELYVTSHLQRSQRSLVAQLRSDILPLAIEVGQFKNIVTHWNNFNVFKTEKKTGIFV